ncbi:aspartate aminotransferase, partial [Xanthomonas citri pv. citri]|nr:aspartate aminotransferase [Xanthomonas citri pv. citri]
GRVAALRAAGHDVVSLCAGEPGGGAPPAVAGHYRRWYGLDVRPEQVAITTGSSGAFMLGFLAAFSPGERVLLSRPGYPAYR